MRILLLATIGAGLAMGAMWPQPAPPPAAAVNEPARKTVIERGSGGAFFVTAKVNGAPVRFVVDTGADQVALTKEDAARAGIAFDPARFTAVARTASGIGMGQTVRIDTLDVDGKARDGVGAIVLEGLDISLLGQNYLRRLEGVEMTGDKMILR